MGESRTVTFAMYETIGIGIPNLNFGGHDPETAQRLVNEGKGRWALCHGSTLSFVPNDYKLKLCESFVQETPTGFEVTETEYGLSRNRTEASSQETEAVLSASDVSEVSPVVGIPK